MLRSLMAGALTGVLWAGVCSAEVVITVDDIDLEPNKAGQIVPIYVSCGESDASIQGAVFRVSVGVDGAGIDQDFMYYGPKITDVDLIGAGAIFSASNNGITGKLASEYTWYGSVITQTDGTGAGINLRPTGLLATVTFDTTEVDPASYADYRWDFSLADGNGVPMTLFGTNGVTVPVTIGNGTVGIATETPEPNTAILLTSLAIGGVVYRLLRQRRRIGA